MHVHHIEEDHAVGCTDRNEYDPTNLKGGWKICTVHALKMMMGQDDVRLYVDVQRACLVTKPTGKQMKALRMAQSSEKKNEIETWN